VEDPLDAERHMAVSFEEREIASRIRDLREFDDPALVQTYIHRLNSMAVSQPYYHFTPVEKDDAFDPHNPRGDLFDLLDQSHPKTHPGGAALQRVLVIHSDVHNGHLFRGRPYENHDTHRRGLRAVAIESKQGLSFEFAHFDRQTGFGFLES